ncbi:MAG: HAD-IA family hydrolase [Actinomycetota bacterium]|nr:HAD-IA family hydrolase [Actinomycetota bacterium]
MHTRALLFDFDGTVVDTEVPAFRAWQEVYERHGHVLSVDEWSSCVGTLGGFEPLDHLEGLLGRALDRHSVDAARYRRKLELVSRESLRRGLEGYLSRAAGLGISVAIVSSGETAWITSNLDRLGRSEGWACINCADGNTARAKPLPCLYEEALDALSVAADEAVVFEDSPNGIRAAKAAGLFCVAVPNPVTSALDLSEADLLLTSFEEMSLDDVLAQAGRGKILGAVAREEEPE